MFDIKHFLATSMVALAVLVAVPTGVLADEFKGGEGQMEGGQCIRLLDFPAGFGDLVPPKKIPARLWDLGQVAEPMVTLSAKRETSKPEVGGGNGKIVCHLKYGTTVGQGGFVLKGKFYEHGAFDRKEQAEPFDLAMVGCVLKGKRGMGVAERLTIDLCATEKDEKVCAHVLSEPACTKRELDDTVRAWVRIFLIHRFPAESAGYKIEVKERPSDGGYVRVSKGNYGREVAVFTGLEGERKLIGREVFEAQLMEKIHEIEALTT